MSETYENSSPVEWETWSAEIPATLMFIVQEGRVLLIDKLTGIGEGKVNGPGGKIDPGETAEQAIVRECQEELHITPLEPVKMGELHFAMSDIPDIHCHVFMATRFAGQPTPTREANPLWTAIESIPYGKMWEDDKFWLPQMLDGQKFNGRFQFEGDKILWLDVTFGDESKSKWLGDPVSAE